MTYRLLRNNEIVRDAKGKIVSFRARDDAHANAALLRAKVVARIRGEIMEISRVQNGPKKWGAFPLTTQPEWPSR